MKTREHIFFWLKSLFVSAVLLLTVPGNERERASQKSAPENPFAGKELTCAIYLRNEITSKKGLETGYNYALLQKFAEDNHCKVNVRVKESEHYDDSLYAKKIDIYITRKGELKGNDSVRVSNVMDSLYIWGISDDISGDKVLSLNAWLRVISGSKDNEERRSRFRGSFNPHRLAEKGVIRKRISPYDNILKEKAADIGWDWRMLAAIVYQESRFSIKAESHRGAKGLMQIMPAVAKKYEVENIIDPEQNISAGVRVLMKLQSGWDNHDMSEIERIKFTLASYNAGEGRIKDCRNLAIAKGYNGNCWDEVVKVIPLMREDSILEEKSVKLGKFQGHETISYINNTFTLYEAICKIHPSK